jgi:hypothetical protein
MENRTEILLHTIEWWVRDEHLEEEIKELDEASIEHIEKSIKEGVREGQLCIAKLVGDDIKEVYGWWSIKKCDC